jgi:imidazolonepropionase-like amidohydrolase
VEEGKQADLVIVDGDPLADIAVLADAERIRTVVKAGEVVKDLDAQGSGGSG